MTKISVGLVDDQPLVRTGFAMLINSQDDMETSWEASDGAEVPTQTHADIPAEVRHSYGLTDDLLRLSIGIEDARDLIADLRQALEG